MSERDPFLTLAERHSALRGAAGRTFSEYTGVILLAVCLLLTAALPLVVLRVENPFSEEFLLRTAYTVLTSTLCYLLFLPEGRRAERRRDPAFSEVEEKLRTLSLAVREGHLSAFYDYCHALGEAKWARRREAALARAALKEGRHAGRLRLRAERLRVRPLSPVQILCGEGRGEPEELSRHPCPRALVGAFLRPLAILVSSLLFSSVTILPGEPLSAATAVRILSGLFGVTMAAFAGYTAGAAAAREELPRLWQRAMLLTAFFEGKPPKATPSV